MHEDGTRILMVGKMPEGIARIRLADDRLVGAEFHWYQAADHVAQQHGWSDAY